MDEDDDRAMIGTLEAQVAIVAGAGRGIGRADALALAQAGASVGVNDASTVGQSVISPAHLPNAAYAASKVRIAELRLACAVELTDLDVRVNAIAPVVRSHPSRHIWSSRSTRASTGCVLIS